MKARKIGLCIIMLMGTFVLTACGAGKEVMTAEMAKQEGKSTGKIYLYGEEPYYTAEFLNLWMQADNDEILDQRNILKTKV